MSKHTNGVAGNTSAVRSRHEALIAVLTGLTTALESARKAGEAEKLAAAIENVYTLARTAEREQAARVEAEAKLAKANRSQTDSLRDKPAPAINPNVTIPAPVAAPAAPESKPAPVAAAAVKADKPARKGEGLARFRALKAECLAKGQNVVKGDTIATLTAKLAKPAPAAPATVKASKPARKPAPAAAPTMDKEFLLSRLATLDVATLAQLVNAYVS